MIRSMARVALAVSLFTLSTVASAQTPKKAAPSANDPQSLALEVSALQTLHRLDLTDAQLNALQRFAKGAASPMRSTTPPKANAGFMKTLTGLRGALIEGDDEKADELKEKLVEIMDKENVQIEDRVAISDAARRNVAAVVRMLNPAQVLAYLHVIDHDEVDLHELLVETLDRGVKMTPAQWKTLRDRTATDGAWLLSGSDESRSRATAKMLAAFLDQHHSDKTSKNNGREIEKQVLQITAAVDPFVILRNAMERDLAEVLSNPSLPGAIQHVLEHRRKVSQ